MNHYIIGVAGGSGSGKSTFTDRLTSVYKDKISVLHHDNYYFDKSDIPRDERELINYDHPQAMETPLLAEHLKLLKSGQAIDMPVYDFTSHTRKPETIHIQPKKIILVEGILILENEELRNLMDIKIFVDADADERILRRITRDVDERGRELNSVISQYLTTVKPMHYLFVEPTKSMADIVLNSGMNDVAFDLIKCKIDKILFEEA